MQSTMLQSQPQLWNQRADTRTIQTKAMEIKSRLVDTMGVQNIGQINSRLKNLSPEQIRSQPVDHIVQVLKGSMVGPNHNNHVLIGGSPQHMPAMPDYANQPNVNYRNGQANFHTANPTSFRNDYSPAAQNFNYQGDMSNKSFISGGQGQQHFPNQGQWVKAQEINIVYNRTPNLNGLKSNVQHNQSPILPKLDQNGTYGSKSFSTLV